MIRQVLRNKGNSDIEKYFWNMLRNSELSGYRFKRQHDFGRYIVDFYCEELKLAIELDAENFRAKNKYDTEREQFINSLGIRYIRISRNELRTALKFFLESLVIKRKPKDLNIL